MAGQAERRRRRKEKLGPRPRLRFRGVTWNLPDPCYGLLRQAHEALVKHKKEQDPTFDLGEQDFAIHVLTQGSREVLGAIERGEQQTKLVQPAAFVPPKWAEEASKRLQAIKGGQA